MPTEKKGIIWWNCFLSSSDSFYDNLSCIGHLLRKNGQELVVLSPEGDYSRCDGFTHVVVTLSLCEMGRAIQNLHTPSQTPTAISAYPELVEAEQQWCGQRPPYETEALILRALHLWEKAFTILRPSVIMAWGRTIPFARLLIRQAQLTQTPCYIAERGLSENTLFLGLLGQGQITDIGLRLPFIAPPLEDTKIEDEWKKITSYYATTSQEKYKTSINEDFIQLQKELENETKPIIVYFGAFDVGSGITFHDTRSGDRLGGWIRHSKDGALAVAESLSRVFPASILLIQPHPGCYFDIENSYDNVDIRSVNGIDYRKLVAISNISVTPISSVQMACFFQNKPVITLCNSFFSGRDIAYEAYNSKDLDQSLLDAFHQKKQAIKHQQAKALIVTLFREEFIGLSDDAPCALKKTHLVQHLARFLYFQPYPIDTAEDRIHSFQSFLNLCTAKPHDWSPQELANAIGQENWLYLKHIINHDYMQELVQIAHSHPFEQEHMHTDLNHILAPARHSYQTLEHSRQELEHSYQTLAHSHQELEYSYQTLERSHQELEHKFQELNHKFNEKLNKFHQLKESSSQKCRTLTETIHATQAKNSSLNNNIEIYKTQNDNNKQKIYDLRNNIDFLNEENRLLKLQIYTLEEKNSFLKSWIRGSVHRYRTKRYASLRNKIFNRHEAKAIAEIDPVDYLFAHPDLAKTGINPDFHWRSTRKNKASST